MPDAAKRVQRDAARKVLLKALPGRQVLELINISTSGDVAGLRGWSYVSAAIFSEPHWQQPQQPETDHLPYGTSVPIWSLFVTSGIQDCIFIGAIPCCAAAVKPSLIGLPHSQWAERQEVAGSEA